MVLNCGHPTKKGYICELERIQRSFTKYISGMQNLSYHQRLNALRLYSLQRRRDRYIVISMWKILENLVPNLIPKVQTYTSGRLCYTQHVPIGHIGTICFNSFSPKFFHNMESLKTFNSLPANIRNTTNCETSVFKKKVDSYLQTILDNPCVPNEDNSLDARINEMRWCTLRGGLGG